MEQLFSGKVYEILPVSNGIVFSYFNRELNDEISEVSYKLVSFDNRRMTNATKSVYMMSKFGNTYKAILKLCSNNITVKSIILPGGKVFLLHEDGKAQFIDADGKPIWTGTLIYKNFLPSDILLFGDGLFVSYEEGNTIVKYSLATMHEEIRIGDGKSIFSGPCDMFLRDDNSVIVCNKKSKKLLSVDFNKYSVKEYESFDEPVYQFIESDSYRFVILESGLYIL